MSCEGVVLHEGTGNYIVRGFLNNSKGSNKLMFWAANPPTRGFSFSGSAMPYPNPETAFQNTPNRGIVNINDGYFEFKLHFPNAFYTDLGSNYVQPTAFVQICGDEAVHKIPLGDGVPFRLLTYPREYWNNRAKFFLGHDSLPQRTQEQILRDSSFPSQRPFAPIKNFWGLSPPQ
jgi:hypothetical protein